MIDIHTEVSLVIFLNVYIKSRGRHWSEKEKFRMVNSSTKMNSTSIMVATKVQLFS